LFATACSTDKGGVEYRREEKPLSDVAANCLGSKKLRVIPTGATAHGVRYRDGNNVIKLPARSPRTRATPTPQHPAA
jgi:hypothetical protein